MASEIVVCVLINEGHTQITAQPIGFPRTVGTKSEQRPARLNYSKPRLRRSDWLSSQQWLAMNLRVTF